MLGSPVSHSLSPLLHRTAYQGLGLDWSYDAVEVRSDGLPAFLERLDGSWRGLSLTMPLKRSVPALAHTQDAWVRLSGAANTVVLDNGVRAAYNTDVPGAVAALGPYRPDRLRRAVVLGGGATAASVGLALAELGCEEIVLLVRDAGRARLTYDAVAAHPARPAVSTGSLTGGPVRADLVAATVPAAAQDAALVRRFEGVPVVFDAVYDRWPTALAAAATHDGRTLVTGLDLLVAQAVRQVALMTGREVDEPLREAMDRAARHALHHR